MAIVKMNKFTLLTFESNKEKLLRKLQSFKGVEFINLQDDELIEKYEELKDLSKEELDSDYVKCEENLSKAKSTLEFLQKFTPSKSMLKELREEKEVLTIEELEKRVNASNWQDIVKLVKEKEAKINGLESEITKLEGEIEALTPWENLDAPFKAINELKSTISFIGSVPKQYEEALLTNLADAFVEIVSRTSNDINILVITHKDNEENISELLRGYGFSSFKTEQEGAAVQLTTDFKAQIEELRTKIFFVKEELAHLEEQEAVLKSVVEYYENSKSRKEAVKNFLGTKSVTTIQGWVPKESNEELNSICSSILGEDFYLEYSEVKHDEIPDVPIKLKNGDLVSSFESVTSMFAYPKYDEVDPTPLLAPFYLIFFGMMVADIGYGMLIMATAIIALKMFNLPLEQKKMAKFFFYLSIPTMFFGVVYGSFFGFVIKSIQIIDTELDIMKIMMISLVFGVIQIFTGLTIKAVMLIKSGRTKDAFFDVGSWVITLVSIGVFAASTQDFGLPMFVKYIGIAGMVIGALLIVYAGGRAEKSAGAKIGQGLYSLYGITGYVSDLVSYTRLMALGLAGGSIAAALNMIINTIPGVAVFIAAPLIFVLGHLFNLGLGLLGAYVHTARLQYIEYFSKFYEGGGREFKPFKATEKYINIK